jgi:hypothetical protein
LVREKYQLTTLVSVTKINMYVYVMKLIFNYVLSTKCWIVDFFRQVHSAKLDDTFSDGYEVKYTAYKPRYGQSMCLFSEQDDSPLACLNLRYQNTNHYAKGKVSLLAELPSSPSFSNKQRFQGVWFLWMIKRLS